MDELIKPEGNNLLRLLHGKSAAVSMLKPFERDIFLFDTYVAGTTHIEGIEELEPYLNIDDRLEFLREPDNPYDSRAIVVKTTDGVKVGYVPQQDNIIFSRLMDADKLLSENYKQRKERKMDETFYWNFSS